MARNASDPPHEPSATADGTTSLAPSTHNLADGVVFAHEDGEGAAITATTPIERGGPRIDTRQSPAAGLGAVTSALRYAVKNAGVARTARVLLRVNQPEGFDCPSCAWPDPDERGFLEFCENGARAVADEATTKRVDAEFFAKHSVAWLSQQSDQWLNAQGRLAQPMILRPGATHYAPISWDDAFGLLARELRALNDPNEAVFYTSGRTSNEAAFLYQLFVRRFGTNNMPDCSNMCHESSGTGLKESIGIGKGTVLLEDFAKADAIFVIGQNPGTNHPRMLTALQEAKHAGCTIVSVNPLREAGLLKFRHPQRAGEWFDEGTTITDLYLQLRVGGDLALFRGINKALLERERDTPGGVFDHDFIAEHTRGLPEYLDVVEQTSWDEILEQSGISRPEIEAAATIAAHAERIICCWAMGITQHKHGVANVQEIVNMLLLRGSMGKPGAGACPVRGHSNVQGDRTMGIWEHLPAWGDRLGHVFGFDPPRAPGLDTVHAIAAMHEGRAKVFVAMGGNFLSATPDTERTAAALQRCRVTAHVSTKLNRAHLVTGQVALILPCLGRTEADIERGVTQFVTVEDSMGVVHRSQGRLAPASSHLLSEPRIVARLATATLGDDSGIDWEWLADDYDRIRDAIADVIPGFRHYNERVRAAFGFVLDNGPRERRFETPDGKAHFIINDLPRLELGTNELWMTTIRSHDQFNTTIYATDDRYRGIYGHRRIVLLHPGDIGRMRLHPGQHVTLTSHFRGEQRHARDFVVVSYDIPEGCAATYFPEANCLVPLESYADKSHTPTSKAVRITIAAQP